LKIKAALKRGFFLCAPADSWKARVSAGIWLRSSLRIEQKLSQTQAICSLPTQF
jgi:hypothetical protein